MLLVRLSRGYIISDLDPKYFNCDLDPKHFNRNLDPKHFNRDFDPKHFNRDLDPKHFNCVKLHLTITIHSIAQLLFVVVVDSHRM